MAYLPSFQNCNLNALVTVERGDGKSFTYKVVSNVTMSLDDVNKYGMQQMMQSVDPNKEGLSLITCAGNYIPRLGQIRQTRHGSRSNH